MKSGNKKNNATRPTAPALEALGNELRAKRLGWKLSQRQLAELAGATQSLIAHIEAGTANPTYKTLNRIAGVMNWEVRLKLVRKIKAD